MLGNPITNQMVPRCTEEKVICLEISISLRGQPDLLLAALQSSVYIPAASRG